MATSSLPQDFSSRLRGLFQFVSPETRRTLEEYIDSLEFIKVAKVVGIEEAERLWAEQRHCDTVAAELLADVEI